MSRPDHLGLLGAHVLGRAERAAELGVRGGRGESREGRLGDAEVDDLGGRRPVDDRDQHVRRLEVAVDDPLLVGVLHRFADGDEELDPVRGVEALAVAVVGDRHPRDEVHHEVGAPLRGRAGVQDARDVRVVHQRQRLALGLEARHELLGVEAPLDQLERDAAADRPLLLGLVDDAHPALADLAHQAIGPDGDWRRTGRDAGDGGVALRAGRGQRVVDHDRLPSGCGDGGAIWTRSGV